MENYKIYDRNKKTVDGTVYFRCTRLRLLAYLRQKGFEVMWQEPDIHNPKYTVYYFLFTEKLEDAVSEYFEDLQIRNIVRAN